MKIATIILMSFLSLSIFGQVEQNGVYVQNGKTVEIDWHRRNAYYSVTPTNESSILHFSNGLTTQLETNSELIITSFDQTVNNTTTNAEKARFGESLMAISLMGGNAYFSYPEDNTNSTCIVSTPFADVELHKGSFYFVVNQSSLLVIVVDGSVVAYGDKRDEAKISAGTALVAIPNTQGILDSKISLSTQFVRDTAMNKYKETFKQLSKSKDSIMFIRINRKTVGVSL